MIAENLRSVREQIAEAYARRNVKDDNPDNQTVTLVAVTKNHPADFAQAAIDAGVTDIGENRVQEAKEKFPRLTADTFLTRHLIGHLQTNKAKEAVRLFDLIHSIDSERLALAVDNGAAKLGKIQDILLQVNLAKETSKGGVYREFLPDLLKTVGQLPHLRCRGFMLMAPAYDDIEKCRPLFREMYVIFRETQEKLKDATNINIEYLSMGMSHDYQIAIEEGANMVRVGTAIFGERQY